MTTFIGTYDAKTDAKGRIFVPASYRRALPNDENGEKSKLVMRKEPDKNCLVIYPKSVWDRKINSLMSQLDEWDSDDQLLLMQFVSEAEWLDVDSQGRVLIKKKYLESIGVENNEVLFVGMHNRFAVWGRNSYHNAKYSSSELAKNLKEKSQKK